jgi:hypothetical protein
MQFDMPDPTPVEQTCDVDVHKKWIGSGEVAWLSLFQFWISPESSAERGRANSGPAASELLGFVLALFFLPTHLHTNHFAANDNLHAPVLFPPGHCAVVGERVGLAEPLGCDRVRRQSLGNQELASCVGSLLRELHVEIWRACIVCVAFNR